MATAATVITTLIGIQQQRQGAKKVEKADRIQSKAAELRNAKARRQRISEARRARAATVAQGQAQGVSGGSSVNQAAGSVVTQSAANEAFASTLANLDQRRFSAIQSANRNFSRASTFSALAQSGAFEGAESIIKRRFSE